MTFVVRFLPINVGVNTLLSLSALVIFSIVLCKIELSKAIKSAIVIYIILFICEIINVGGLMLIFGSDKADALLTETTSKTLYRHPLNGSLCDNGLLVQMDHEEV